MRGLLSNVNVGARQRTTATPWQSDNQLAFKTPKRLSNVTSVLDLHCNILRTRVVRAVRRRDAS